MNRVPGTVVVAIGIVIFFAYALYETQTWSTRSRTYGIGVAALGLVLALSMLAREVIRQRRPGAAAVAPVDYGTPVGLRSVAWAAGFFASIWLVGLIGSVPLFSAAYLRLAARTSWIVIALYAAIGTSFIYLVFVYLLHIPLPTGLLFGGRTE